MKTYQELQKAIETKFGLKTKAEILFIDNKNEDPVCVDISLFTAEDTEYGKILVQNYDIKNPKWEICQVCLPKILKLSEFDGLSISEEFRKYYLTKEDGY